MQRRRLTVHRKERQCGSRGSALVSIEERLVLREVKCVSRRYSKGIPAAVTVFVDGRAQRTLHQSIIPHPAMPPNSRQRILHAVHPLRLA